MKKEIVNMYIRKTAIIALLLLIVMIFFVFPLYIAKPRIINATLNNETKFSSNVFNQTPLSVNKQAVSSASQKNNEIIDEIFQTKLNNFSTFNYFPQFYEPSFQAIYYVLYILNKLDRLDQINKTEILNFITSYYNESTHLFSDKYSQRYLDTDFSQIYYPLSSFLEVNCYAILSLDILNRLDLINIQEFIDFIWSCYNKETSGFTGRPYDTSLSDNFKLSTMDNTYYAITTLNMLMEDWVPYINEKYELIQHISDLQSVSSSFGVRGGFSNDKDPSFKSLEVFEPNLFSSYYCIRSLEAFGVEDSINVPNFKQYLKDLYDTTNKKFSISYGDSDDDYLDVVATAIGVDLSDLMGFTAFDRTAAINFVLNNRDSWGIWYGWTTTKYHELVDSFEIIRSLSDSGELSRLSAQEKNQILLALEKFRSFNGYSLISRDYASQKLMYIIASACELYDRISDLDLQYFYDCIENSYYYHSYLDYYGFCACVNFIQTHIGFRSRPIEYYNSGNHDLTEEIDVMVSHKSTYMALVSLKKAFKLDDFQLTHNLAEFVDTVLDSQFLVVNQENFGAFLPFATFSLMSPEQQNKKIFFEYSYYAIKALELLASHLELGNITNLGFDKDALCAYMFKNIVETPSLLFFDPRYSNDLEVILQNTYYAIYIFKALNRYKLSDWKIKNFVNQSVNYANIKSVYYSYKISEILNLNIEFNIELTQKLVQQAYSERFHEFYLTTDRTTFDQEAFAWVCEMAKKDRVRIFANYSKIIPLESDNIVSASLGNLILNEFGPYTIVKFESNQLGTFVLDPTAENLFQKHIFVPARSQHYPSVQGHMRAYEGAKKVAEIPISFNTAYEIDYNDQLIVKNYNEAKVQLNASLLAGIGARSLVAEARATAEIYKDSIYLESVAFSRQDFSKLTSFNLRYNIENESSYLFKIFLCDGIDPILKFVGALTSSGKAYVILDYAHKIDLGSSNVLRATLYNFMSGPTTVVKFESQQLGSIVLDKEGNNQYQKTLEVPTASNYYPLISGNVCVYENDVKVVETPLSFDTTYEIVCSNQSIVKSFNEVMVQFNASFVTGAGARSLVTEACTTAEIYKDSIYLETIAFSRQDFSGFTSFTLRHDLENESVYLFKVFLDDGISPTPQFVNALSVSGDSEEGGSEDPEPDPNPNTDESNTDQRTLPNTIDSYLIIVIVIFAIAMGLVLIIFIRAFLIIKRANKKKDEIMRLEIQDKPSIKNNFEENDLSIDFM